jgi:hypothetical protein
MKTHKGYWKYTKIRQILFIILLNASEQERNGSEKNFESFLFHGTAGNLPEQTICFVYSVFRTVNFGSEIPNPTL